MFNCQIRIKTAVILGLFYKFISFITGNLLLLTTFRKPDIVATSGQTLAAI